MLCQQLGFIEFHRVVEKDNRSIKVKDRDSYLSDKPLDFIPVMHYFNLYVYFFKFEQEKKMTNIFPPFCKLLTSSCRRRQL